MFWRISERFSMVSTMLFGERLVLGEFFVESGDLARERFALPLRVEDLFFVIVCGILRRCELAADGF